MQGPANALGYLGNNKRCDALGCVGSCEVDRSFTAFHGTDRPRQPWPLSAGERSLLPSIHFQSGNWNKSVNISNKLINFFFKTQGKIMELLIWTAVKPF